MDDLFAPIFRTLVGSLVEESIRYFDKQFEVVTQAENPSKVFLSEAEIAKASTMSFFGGLVEGASFLQPPLLSVLCLPVYLRLPGV